MPKRILVVDDDPDALELLSFSLKKAGFSIGTARNGLDALKKACSVAPDLILLDLMMPELDGLAVCETLRRDPSTAAIPIIFVTAVSSEFGRLTGLEAGASAYITKPYSPRELVNRVKAILTAES
jgi:DNA-binding response OmpR family regulator